MFKPRESKNLKFEGYERKKKASQLQSLQNERFSPGLKG